MFLNEMGDGDMSNMGYGGKGNIIFLWAKGVSSFNIIIICNNKFWFI
jgi:hypothetical protein